MSVKMMNNALPVANASPAPEQPLRSLASHLPNAHLQLQQLRFALLPAIPTPAPVPASAASFNIAQPQTLLANVPMDTLLQTRATFLAPNFKSAADEAACVAAGAQHLSLLAAGANAAAPLSGAALNQLVLSSLLPHYLPPPALGHDAGAPLPAVPFPLAAPSLRLDAAKLDTFIARESSIIQAQINALTQYQQTLDNLRLVYDSLLGSASAGGADDNDRPKDPAGVGAQPLDLTKAKTGKRATDAADFGTPVKKERCGDDLAKDLHTALLDLHSAARRDPKRPDRNASESPQSASGDEVPFLSFDDFSPSAAADADRKLSRPKRGHYRKYDTRNLMEAVLAVKTGRMSVHRAGNHFGVPHSTLEYKVKERHLQYQQKKLQRESRKQGGGMGSGTGGDAAADADRWAGSSGGDDSWDGIDAPKPDADAPVDDEPTAVPLKRLADTPTH